MSSLVPEAFIDPITQDIFTDPVVTSDGHTCRLLKSTTPVLQCSHARSASTAVSRPWTRYARRDFARKMGSSGPNGPHRKPPLRATRRDATHVVALRAVEHAAGPILEAGRRGSAI